MTLLRRRPEMLVHGCDGGGYGGDDGDSGGSGDSG